MEAIRTEKALNFIGTRKPLFFASQKPYFTTMRRARSIQEIVDAPEEVVEISLKDIGLDAFPKEILACENLQVMDLSQNQIANVPDELGNLKKLTHLNLSFNPLVELPTTLGELVNLRKLELRNGDLVDLPTGLGQLKSLSSLRLDRNHLTSLPEELGACTQLIELTLSENQLETLPTSSGQLLKLHSIDLSSNSYTTFPRILGSLPLLSYVQFQDNPIEENHPVEQLSKWIGKFFEERGKAKLKPSRSQAWLDVLLLNYQDCLAHAPADIFAALDAPMPHVRGNGLAVLEQILEDPFRSSPPKTIVFSGFIPDFNMGEVTDELEAIGIQTKGNLPRKDAMLVIGEKPGRHLKTALQRQLPIAVPSQVLAFLDRNEGKFLGAAGKQDEAMVENLMGMLRSDSAENRDLGLTLMESGGVPAEMVTDLVARWLFSEEEKERFRCERLLTNHGPKALLSRIRSQLKIQENRSLPWADLLLRISRIQPIQRNELYKSALKSGQIQLKEVLDMRGMDVLPLLQEAVTKGELNLYNAGLDKLPSEVLQVKDLKALYLVSNSLDRLPSNIDNLDQLTRLNVRQNQLESLPSGIGLLSKLEELNLSLNRIHSLPETIYGLKNLRRLDLSQNPIEDLPLEMQQLPGLEVLDLRNCRLSECPEVVWQIPALQKLLLSYNRLVRLPEEFPTSKHLRVVDLAHNQLNKFPDWLGQFQSMRRLFLEGNPAKELPPSLGSATRLEELSLAPDLNWEQAIPVLKGLSSLRVLRIPGEFPREGFDLWLMDKLPECRIQWK